MVCIATSLKFPLPSAKTGISNSWSIHVSNLKPSSIKAWQNWTRQQIDLPYINLFQPKNRKTTKKDRRIKLVEKHLENHLTKPTTTKDRTASKKTNEEESVLNHFKVEKTTYHNEYKTAQLMQIIEGDYPIVDDRAHSIIRKFIFNEFPSMSLSEGTKAAKALHHLGYSDRARQLLRASSQGITFAPTDDISSFCEIMVDLFNTPIKTSVSEKPSHCKLLQKMVASRRRYDVESDPNLTKTDTKSTLSSSNQSSEFTKWEQGPSGWNSIINCISDRLFEELQQINEFQLEKASNLLLAISTFWFSPQSKSDVLGSILSKRKNQIFSDTLRYCTKFYHGDTLNNDWLIGCPESASQGDAVVKLRPQEYNIRLISPRSILNIAKAFRLRAEFAENLDNHLPSPRETRLSETEPSNLSFVGEQYKWLLQKYQRQIANESKLITKFIAHWAIGNIRVDDNNIPVGSNFIPNIATLSISHCVELIRDTITLIKGSKCDQHIMKFIALTISHLKSNISDFVPDQAMLLLVLLSDLQNIEMEEINDGLIFSVKERLASKNNVSEVSSESYNEDWPSNHLSNRDVQQFVPLNNGEETNKSFNDNSNCIVEISELLDGFIQVITKGVHILDIRCCVELLVLSQHLAFDEQFIELLSLRVKHQIDNIAPHDVVQLVHVLSNSRIFQKGHSCKFLLQRCLNEISYELINPNEFGILLRSIAVLNAFSDISLLKYRSEQYILSNSKRFELTSIADIMEAYEIANIQPSLIIQHALTSSFLDGLHSENSLNILELARCLSASFHWPSGCPFSSELQSWIIDTITPHIEYLPPSLIITFILHRGHGSLSLISGLLFHSLAPFVGKLSGQQLNTVFCSYCRNPKNIPRGNGIIVARELTRRSELSVNDPLVIEAQFLAESYHVLITIEESTCLTAETIESLSLALLNALAIRRTSLTLPQLADLFVALGTTTSIVKDNSASQNLAEQIAEDLVNQLSEFNLEVYCLQPPDCGASVSLGISKNSPAELPVQSTRGSSIAQGTSSSRDARASTPLVDFPFNGILLENFLIRCLTGITLNTDGNKKFGQLKSIVIQLLNKTIQNFDVRRSGNRKWNFIGGVVDAKLLQALECLGRLQEQLAESLLKLLSCRINEIASKNLEHVVDIAAELNTLGIYSRLSSRVQYQIYQLSDEICQQLLSPTAKSSYPIKKAQAGSASQDRMTLHKYVQLKNIPKMKSKAVILPIPPFNNHQQQQQQTKNPSGNSSIKSYMELLKENISNSEEL